MSSHEVSDGSSAPDVSSCSEWLQSDDLGRHEPRAVWELLQLVPHLDVPGHAKAGNLQVTAASSEKDVLGL